MVGQHRGAVALEQLVDAATDGRGPGDQGAHVAQRLLRQPAVAGDDPEHVVLPLAGDVEADGRQQQALGVGVDRQRRQAAGVGPADVGDVDHRGPDVGRPPVGEHRPEHHDVVGVDAAPVRVVQGVHVAGLHVRRGDVLEAATAARTAGSPHA